MLLRPLFFTSFLIDDQLADNGSGAGRSLISSASSKTAIGRGLPAGAPRGSSWSASPRRATPSSSRVSGSTTGSSPTTRSTRSRATGHASSTSPATARCARRPLPLRRRARPQHGRGGDALGGAQAGGGSCPGPAPTFFFAPDRWSSVRRLGPRHAGHARSRGLVPVLRVDRHVARRIHDQGFDELQKVYVELARGAHRADDGPRAVPLARCLGPPASEPRASFSS